MIYESWLYFGGLYHLNNLVKIGSYIAHQKESWWIEREESSVNSWNLGVLGLFTF